MLGDPPLMGNMWLFLGVVVPVVLTVAGALLWGEKQLENYIKRRRQNDDIR